MEKYLFVEFMKSRKVIKIISGSLFIIFLTLFVFDDSFTQLTSYENLKPIVLQIIANSLSGNISQAELNQSYNIMLLACEDKKSIEVPLTNIGNITIPCDQINSTTPQNLDNLIASLAFDKIYYTEFSCDFINCIKENNYNVIFSSYGNKFFCNLQPYLLIITIALGILFFFSLENLFEKLKSFGAALLFSSIPNVALNYLKDYASKTDNE